MRYKKHYPERNHLRHQGKRVCHAVNALVAMGIEIIKIDFCQTAPVIEVYPCAGIDSIKFHEIGQGHSEHGKYIRKAAHLKGCQVEWNEGVV